MEQNTDTSWRGNCYINAIEYLFKNNHSEMRVVHGIVIGMGPNTKGHEIVHAWVEDDFYCYDHNAATNNVEQIDKLYYYRLGNVKLKSVRKYDKSDIVKHVSKVNHAGPWDEDLFNHALTEEGSVYEDYRASASHNETCTEGNNQR